MSYLYTEICPHLHIVSSADDDTFEKEWEDDEILFCQDCNKVEFENPEIRKTFGGKRN